MTEFKFNETLTYFVDTNIWLYAFIQTQDLDKTKIAKQIVSNTDVLVSTQIINEMCVNLIKKASFTEATIRQMITSIYQKYTVFELSSDVFTLASTVSAYDADSTPKNWVLRGENAVLWKNPPFTTNG